MTRSLPERPALTIAVGAGVLGIVGLVWFEPIAATAFLLAAVALAGLVRRSLSAVSPWAAAGVAAIGAVQLARFVAGDAAATSPAVGAQATAAARAMSPVAAACFLAAGTALLLTRWPSRRRVVAAQVLAAGLVLAGFNALTSHISGLSGTDVLHFVSLYSVVGFVLLGIGTLFVSPDHGVGPIFADRGAGGRQLRQILPAVTLVPLLVHAVALKGYQAGWYDAAVANSMLSTGNACILAAVTIWSSQRSAAIEAARLRLLIELAASESQLRSTFDNGFVGIGVIDPVGRWLQVNQRLCEILRRDRASLVGGPASASLPDEVMRTIAELRGARSAEPARLQVGSGELTLDVGISVLAGQPNEPRRCLVIVHDTTEVYRHAELLRLRERALESTINGIVITDARQPDQPIVYANPAFTSITGYAASEVMGRNCRLLNAGLHDQPELAKLRQAIAAGEPCSVQLRNRRKDGTEFWNRLSVSPVHSPRGELTHWVGVQEDVTAQFAAAHEREDLLRAAVADRERAEKASTARDVLLAVVSHELRSPLNAMRLWASLLARRPDPETVARAAQQIELGIAAQSRLVGDLVDVSRIKSGQLELDRYPVDVGALAERVFESLRPVGAERGLTMACARPPHPLVIDGDGGRLEQAVRNLVDNAIKFTEASGQVKVTVGESAGMARIVVADTGRGLDAQQQQHAFDPFWQGGNAETRSHCGLGLGLYLVREIVTRHGGEISVHSDGPKRGAEFVILLPLTSKPVPSVAITVTPERGVKILVVDDEPSTVEALVLALRSRGYDSHTAHNVDEALVCIHERRPRILLSDIMMPGRSGIELIGEVRSGENGHDGRRLHAIAMSGRGSPSDRRRLLAAGFDDFLQKPIDIDGLVSRIDSVLAQSSDK